MEWADVKLVMGEELQAPGVYVISEFKNRGPYKIGIATHRLDKRLGNFQTCFRTFYVYKLIVFARGKERAAETLVHRFLKDDVRGHNPKFPSGRGSEWFAGSQRKIRAALAHLKKANLPSVYGYGFWGGEPKLDKEWVNFDLPSTTLRGRRLKPKYHAHPTVGNIDFR